jgi:hypothetical protein
LVSFLYKEETSIATDGEKYHHVGYTALEYAEYQLELIEADPSRPNRFHWEDFIVFHKFKLNVLSEEKMRCKQNIREERQVELDLEAQDSIARRVTAWRTPSSRVVASPVVPVAFVDLGGIRAPIHIPQPMPPMLPMVVEMEVDAGGGL